MKHAKCVLQEKATQIWLGYSVKNANNAGYVSKAMRQHQTFTHHLPQIVSPDVSVKKDNTVRSRGTTPASLPAPTLHKNFIKYHYL